MIDNQSYNHARVAETFNCSIVSTACANERIYSKYVPDAHAHSHSYAGSEAIMHGLTGVGNAIRACPGGGR